MTLLEKYNTAIPRYTSYPTVPAWNRTPDQEEWKQMVRGAYLKNGAQKGLSLYVHLPFCESLCTYCACNTRITVNHAVEIPYIEAALKEWAMYREVLPEKPLIRELHLGGGTPTFFRAQNLALLIDGLLDGCEIHTEHDFSFEGHPSNTTAAHLQTLASRGFRRVSFGIQDFDERVQEAINRYQSPQEVDEVVTCARQNGYNSVNFDLVYGLPFQTEKSMERTLEQVLRLKPDRIAFYSYAHVPWLKPGQRKFSEKDLPLAQTKRHLYEMGKMAFEQAGYSEIGMDHFALPGDTLFKAQQNQTLHRNFMGYTDRATDLLIGLGTSAISDSWNGFAQNVKTVEGYQQQISKGQLPIFKGHTLSAEELESRQHILNIMCRLRTTWPAVPGPLIRRALSRCEPLERDGLITIESNALQVTDIGRGFLRNICACFDEHLYATPQEHRKFSSVA